MPWAWRVRPERSEGQGGEGGALLPPSQSWGVHGLKARKEPGGSALALWGADGAIFAMEGEGARLGQT